MLVVQSCFTWYKSIFYLNETMPEKTKLTLFTLWYVNKRSCVMFLNVCFIVPTAVVWCICSSFEKCKWGIEVFPALIFLEFCFKGTLLSHYFLWIHGFNAVCICAFCDYKVQISIFSWSNTLFTSCSAVCWMYHIYTLSKCPGDHPILYWELKLNSKNSAGKNLTRASGFSPGDISKTFPNIYLHPWTKYWIQTLFFM